MRSWLVVWRGLSAMDAAMAAWARKVGVSPAQVPVLLALAELRQASTASLSEQLGRPRQQVHRTLEALRAEAKVEPASKTSAGRVRQWRLTPGGQEVAQRLLIYEEAWEGLVGTHLDLGQLRELIHALTERLLDRPGNDGWQKHLMIPAGLTKRGYRKQPAEELWAQLEAEGQLAGAAVTPKRADSEALDEDAMLEQWRRIWDPPVE